MRSHLQGISERFTAVLAILVTRLYSLFGELAARSQTVLRTPRIVVSALVLALLVTVAFGVVAYRAFAIGDGQVFDGTKAPGAHEWRTLNRDNVEADFCGKCHAKIVAEVAATRAANSHPIATCEGCHGVKTAGHGHVAVPRKCSDCHPTQAQELRDDAHASFITDIGESADRPSWSCKACHTKVNIEMQVTPIAPLKLVLGGVNATAGEPIVTPTAVATPGGPTATPTVVPLPGVAGGPTPTSGGDAQRGQAVYNGFCNACHPGGRQGAGPAIVGRSASQTSAIVRSGKGGMPAFGPDRISDQQLNDLASYVSALR